MHQDLTQGNLLGAYEIRLAYDRGEPFAAAIQHRRHSGRRPGSGPQRPGLRRLRIYPDDLFDLHFSGAVPRCRSALRHLPWQRRPGATAAGSVSGLLPDRCRDCGHHRIGIPLRRRDPPFSANSCRALRLHAGTPAHHLHWSSRHLPI